MPSKYIAVYLQPHQTKIGICSTSCTLAGHGSLPTRFSLFTLLAGKIGKQPGVIKPFANLRVAQLRDELCTRGVLDDDHPKKELQQKLTSILKGVQRVPILLLFNPTKNTGRGSPGYIYYLSETLHDIKGHLGNLKELPYILPHKVRENTQKIIEAKTKEKMTGADYRVAAIELLLSLMQANVDPAITPPC